LHYPKGLVFLIAALVLAACGRDTVRDWQPERLIDQGDPQGGAGLYSSLALHPSGSLHVAYYHADLGELRHAYTEGGAWTVETVDGGGIGDRGRQARLAVGDEGALFIAYQNPVTRNVELALRAPDADNWALETVDDSNFRLGAFLDLGLVRGAPAVAYYDESNGDLMYALRGADGWKISNIDADGDVGRYVAMDVDHASGVHLSYYDATRGALKYAFWDGTAARTEWVDGFPNPATEGEEPISEEEIDRFADGDVGTWTRIVAQPLGATAAQRVHPKILYHDRVNYRLMLAEHSEGGWETSVVDDQGYVGTDSDLLWFADGELMAVYFDATNLDLKLARRTPTGWWRQTLLSQGAVGMYNSMAFLGENQVGLTTYNLSQGSLTYLLVPRRP
jgi:hypothetical protein